ncbi:hypothetical protein [Calorimonas adulescens]|uniref:Uncharacterized protein n=1 Tax=Calorimonas adulescens TaxID=2606906 RepID=A0A5D8QB50_9THEO|nr:hypothetical protein [Calorimonas adulescens]TZE81741.1 hypothetical protein FWJ32_08410 [Calorimonas adulescens]
MKGNRLNWNLNSNNTGEIKSDINGINKTFASTVDVVASIELFEEYVYIKDCLNKLGRIYIEDELSNKFSYVEDAVIGFKQTLNMESRLKGKKVFEFYQAKKRLMDYYEEYKFLASYAHHVYRLCSYWRDRNDRYHRKYDLREFYKNLSLSLKRADVETVKDVEQEILSIIPLRITKDFFYRYLNNSISDLIERDPEGAAEMLYDIYDIISIDFSGSYAFADNIYARNIKRYSNMNYKGMSKRKLSIYCTELRRYAVTLDMISDVIWSYIMASNHIIMILLDFDMNYRSLIKLEPDIATAYEYVLSLNDDEGAAIEGGRTLFCHLRETMYRWYDVLKRYSQVIGDISSMNTSEDMAVEELVDIFNYFYYFNALALEDDEMEFDGNYEVTQEELYSAFNDIMSEIDFKLSYMKPDERKIVIKDILSNVSPVFNNIDEFTSFVKKSLEFDTTDAEKAFSIKGINEILKRYKLLA